MRSRRVLLMRSGRPVLRPASSEAQTAGLQARSALPHDAAGRGADACRLGPATGAVPALSPVVVTVCIALAKQPYYAALRQACKVEPTIALGQ